MFLSARKVLMALMSPMVPMEIRSSMLMPVFSNRRAIYTTSRRFRSMSVCRACGSPCSRRAMTSVSSSLGRGGGKVSLPPIYMILSRLRRLCSHASSRLNSFFMLPPLRSAPQGLIPAAVADRPR